MPKYIVAPAGTNPMDMPELYRRRRAGKLRVALAIGLAVLMLACICGVPAYFLTRPKPAVAEIGPSATPISATTTMISNILGANRLRPAEHTPNPSATSSPTTHLVATQTARVQVQYVDKIAVTVQVVKVEIPVTVIITATPPPTGTPTETPTTEPTQTPWIITQIVEVTSMPTETPTPTLDIPTSEPTETPTEPTVTPTETPTEPTETPTETPTEPTETPTETPTSTMPPPPPPPPTPTETPAPYP